MGNALFWCKCKEEDLKQSSINSITTSVIAKKNKDPVQSTEKKTDESDNQSPMPGMEYYNVFSHRIIFSSEMDQNIQQSLVLEPAYTNN